MIIFKKAKEELKDMSALDLCLEYQKNKEDKYYDEMIRQFKPDILTFTKKINDLVGYGDDDKEFDDYFIEVLLMVQKIMLKIDMDQVNNPEGFSFHYWLNVNVNWYIKDQIKRKGALKRKNLRVIPHDIGDTVLIDGRRKKNRHEKSAEFYFMEKEFFVIFKEILSTIEQKVVDMLFLNFPLKEIGDTLGINPYYYKRKIKNKFIATMFD